MAATGYLPADGDDHVLFFVRTGQWDRDDAADPTGDLLYQRWLDLWGSMDWHESSRASWLDRLVRESGRPSPRERWLAENPADEDGEDGATSEPENRRRGDDGPTGSWHGSYGSPGGFHT